MFAFLIFACAQDPMEQALIEEPSAVNVMHGFTSQDLSTWKHEGIIAYGLASLGMAVDSDGSLLITAIQEVRPPSWWEQRTSPPVRGYHFDGTTWSGRAWKVEDKDSRSFIDPQMFEGQMWYISPKGHLGDPALNKNPTPIRSSNPGIDRYVDYHVADPSPVRFKGELHLFASRDLHILHAKGDPLKRITSNHSGNKIFNQASVPYALRVDDEIWLVAQRNIGGQRIPVLSTSKDAENWSDWVPIGNIPRSIRNCTSPVLGPHPKGGWILLCIEERLH